MNFQEVTEQARGNIGPYCKACNVCNGAVSYTHLQRNDGIF